MPTLCRRFLTSRCVTLFWGKPTQFKCDPALNKLVSQILRMSGNYVRRLGQEVFKNAGLLNLQRIFMNNCHVQVGTLTILSLSTFNLGTTFTYIMVLLIKLDLNTISAWNFWSWPLARIEEGRWTDIIFQIQGFKCSLTISFPFLFCTVSCQIWDLKPLRTETSIETIMPAVV